MGGCASSQSRRQRGLQRAPISRTTSSCKAVNNKNGGTIRVIHYKDGRLLEFNPPICVAQILNSLPQGRDSYIVCSSETMMVDWYTPQMGEEEELKPAHLYFLLPKSHSQTPLSLEDLCALAIKASSSLSLDDLRFSFRRQHSF